MGKKDKNKKKGKGAEKTAMKTDKKLAAKHKKMLEKVGEADIAEVIARLEQEQLRLNKVLEENCPPPTPRVNFSLVAHPEKEELVLFGGELYNGSKVQVYNDMFFYNIAKDQWKQLKSPGGPTPRSGHQMVAVASDGGQLWLYGGEHASPSQLQFYHYKDLWCFGLKSRQWEKVSAPNGPSARSGHRMVASKRRLVVFGGFYDNYQSYRYYNDVHVFSLDSRTWLNVKVEGSLVPAPRSGGCMAACADGKILIWGGYTKTSVGKRVERGCTYSDMFALIPDKQVADGSKWKWSTVKPGGNRPTPCNSVGCAVAPNGKAYCFGGVMDVNEDEENLLGQFTQDLHALDLTALTWRLLDVREKPKTPVANAKMEVEPMETEQPVVSSDGVFSVTVAGASKSAPAVSAMPSLFRKQSRNAPTPRMHAGLCICKGTLYLFGGLYEEDERQYTYNDFYALDLHKLDAWKVIVPNSEDVHEWLESDSESDKSTMTTDADDDSDSESDEDDDDDEDQNSSEMETE